MASHSSRVPLEDEYALALGRAVYIFARLEWQVVWCAEKLEPGFLRGVGKLTAGGIGKKFKAIVERSSDAPLKAELSPLADEFLSLVADRNDLLHANPGTVTPTGEQRLFRKGKPWQPADIGAAAEAFAECAHKLNSIYYRSLETVR